MTNENAKPIEVERAAWKLLDVLEDPGSSPEDETRAALELRRALGERPDPLAALEAAERALLVAGGWTQDAQHPEWWERGVGARERRSFAVAVDKERVRLTIAKGGAS